MEDFNDWEAQWYKSHCAECGGSFVLSPEEQLCMCRPPKGEDPLACEAAEHRTYGAYYNPDGELVEEDPREILDPRTLETND